MSPVETDYAWAAGFLDGEGCFQAQIRKAGPTYRPMLSAAQSDRAPLDKLVDLFGGSICFYVPTGRPNDAVMGKWSLQSAESIKIVIPKVLPYLVVKRREAELLLALCNLIGPLGYNRVSDFNRLRRKHICHLIVAERKARKLRNMPCP